MHSEKSIFAIVLGYILFLTGNCLFADTYTVVNTNDSGAGSLRQAIIDANEHDGEDEIIFQIPAGDPGYRASDGVWTIKPLTVLPTISDHGLTIDGATQSQFIGTDTNPDGPEIELDGSLTPHSNGFYITGSGTTIFEIIINRFSENSGIFMDGVDGGRISGCYIGTDAKGMARASNNCGIILHDHSNFVNVTPREDKFNIVSGNPNVGISLNDSCKHNIILGNRIGVNRTCQDTLGNGTYNGYGGVNIEDQSDSNMVIENWICGNRHAGVTVTVSSGNTITANFIGTNEDWSLDLGNVQIGVFIRSDSYSQEESKENTVIGNRIGYNGLYGVMVEYEKSYGNLLSENRISKNGSLGIYLSNGANGNIAPPDIITASNSEITGQAVAFQTVEIFCDENNEGRIFLGKTTSDASGNFTYTPASPPPLTFITATATDADNNTSAFSDPVLLTGTHADRRSGQPDKFSLKQNFPNPFNPETSITYSVQEPCRVVLKVFDLQGREVSTLVDADKLTGEYTVQFNASKIASGIYLYQIRMKNFIGVKKMVILE